jgi:glycosyltransferase involved in cell wall biosynthesis
MQTWLDYLLPGLAAKGWEPLLGLASGTWHAVPAYERAHPGHRTIAIPNPTGSREGRIRALTEAIRQLAPDIVAGVNIPDTYAAVARVRSPGNPSPRAVMTIHGIQPDLFEDAACFRSALDGVICTNRLALKLASAHGVEPSKLHYAPYGVEVPGSVESARRDGSRLRLAWVGRLENWQKRVADLPAIVRALLAHAIDFELLIAGAGPAEEDLRRALAAEEPSGRVRFLGSLDSTRLIETVYSHADALLLTSSWETGPIVIWEAMAHGVAVVSSRYVGSGTENALRDDRNCLLFPVGDVESAARQIARLRDPALRQRLVDEGRALVASRYSRAASIDAWDRSLRAILAVPSASRASDEAPQVLPAGRLDRWLGTSGGETVRRIAGLRFHHSSAGGEWPHSYGTRAEDDSRFWEQARRFDTEIAAAAAEAG